MIQRTTAVGGETSITFSGIPSTYKHLQLRAMSKDTYSTSALVMTLLITLNSDSGTNYSLHRVYGNGSTVGASGTGTTSPITFQGNIASATGQTNTFGVSIIDILDYASTSKYKTLKAFSGADWNSTSTNQRISLESASWQSTSAVTSVTISKDTTAFAAGSTFALYGFTG